MKLFSRDVKKDVDEEYDVNDLPTKDDLGDDFFAIEQDITPEPASQDHNKVNYGIEKAIGLMRNLPRENSELVVTVVNQTLKSMNIAVEDIISSAEQKEQRIRDQQQRLEQDVRELEDQIRQRHEDIETLMDDLRETSDVKQRLIFALDLEQKATRRDAVVSRPQDALSQEVGDAPEGGLEQS